MTFNIPETNNIPVKEKQKVLKLTGTYGNAFALMGTTQAFNRQNKYYTAEQMKAIFNECRSKDYNHLLVTLMYFFNVR